MSDTMRGVAQKLNVTATLQVSSLGAAPLALAPDLPVAPSTACTSTPRLGNLCGSAADGAIAGIVVGSVLLAAIVVAIVIWSLTRSRNKVTTEASYAHQRIHLNNDPI